MVLAFEKSLDGTIKVATDFLNILKKEEQNFLNIQELCDEGNNQEVLDYIDGLFKEDETAPIYEEELKLLKDEIQADILFAQIQGYADKGGKSTQLCQITDENILCAHLLTGATSYRDIVAVHTENENSLRMEVAEESDLLFTNLNEDSFTLDGEHYDVVSEMYAEKTIADKPGRQTIEDVFDKELLKEG